MSVYALRQGISRELGPDGVDGYGLLPLLIPIFLGAGAVGSVAAGHARVQAEAEAEAAAGAVVGASPREIEYPVGVRGNPYVARRTLLKLWLLGRTGLYQNQAMPLLANGDSDSDFIGYDFRAAFEAADFPYQHGLKINSWDETASKGPISALNYFLFGSQCDETGTPIGNINVCAKGNPGGDGNPYYLQSDFTGIINDTRLATGWMNEFDGDTEAALKQFQRAHNLTPSGETDREFWRYVFFGIRKDPCDPPPPGGVCEDIVMLSDICDPPCEENQVCLRGECMGTGALPDPGPEEPRPAPTSPTKTEEKLQDQIVDALYKKRQRKPPTQWYTDARVWMGIGGIVILGLATTRLIRGRKK